MFKTSILVVAVLFSSQLAAEKIYKWVDENGQIHYAAQKPAGQEVETVKIKKAPKTESTAEDDTNNQATEVAASETGTADAEAQAAAKARLAEADKINNKKQCELARKNYAALNASVRVSRTNEQGEKVRMTDDERVKAMQAAQQGIKKYCQ